MTKAHQTVVGSLPKSALFRKLRWLVLLFALIAVAIPIAVYLIPQPPPPITMKDELAKLLNTPSLYVNLPPAPQRYPGSVFTRTHDEAWIPVSWAENGDPDLVIGQDVGLSCTIGNSVAASGGTSFWNFRDLVTSSAVENWVLDLTHIRIYEMAEGKLLDRLSKSEKVSRSSAKQLHVITRCWEAEGSVRIFRNRNATGEAWMALKKKTQENAGNQKFKFDSGSDKSITIQLPDKIVIAFCLDDLRFDADDKGESKIRLVPITPEEFERTRPEP
jgi:hypothetical protein